MQVGGDQVDRAATTEADIRNQAPSFLRMFFAIFWEAI